MAIFIVQIRIGIYIAIIGTLLEILYTREGENLTIFGKTYYRT